MRSTLDDIDEDEPAPIVVPRPGSIKPANPSVMDDLFGPSSSGPATTSTTSSAAAAAAPSAAPKTDALDDFFGQNTKKASPQQSPQLAVGGAASKTQADVFDSLFASPSVSKPSPSPAGGNGISMFAGSVPASSPFDTQQAAGRARTAQDQLAAFSAVMSGGAAPWTKTASVADSKAIDFDGKGGAAGRVFVPPDSVISLMTLYDVLGAAPGWSLDDISKAYKKKALQLHPDKLQGGRTEQEDRYFKIITAAFDIIKDEDKRREYDAALKANGGSSASWLSFVA